MSRNPGRAINRREVIEKVLAKLREGHSRSAASAAAGLYRTTLFRWLRKDAKLRNDVEMAEATAEIELVDRLLELARGGDREAILKILKRRHSDEWGDLPVNARVAFGGDPRHSFASDPLVVVQIDLRELERVEAANEARAKSSTPAKANGETTPLIDEIVEATTPGKLPC